MNNILVFATEKPPDFSPILNNLTVWFNAVIGIVVGIAVLFAIAKGIWIWIRVVNAADEPNLRAELLKSLKWIIIAIIGMLIILGLGNIIIAIIKNSTPILET